MDITNTIDTTKTALNILRHIVISYLILSSFYSNGQKVSKPELIKAKWCTDNLNRKFYNSDTVYLYTIIDTLTEIQKLNIYYRELDYNNTKDITEIKLKRRGRAEVADHNVDTWTISRRKGKWKWKYDSLGHILKLFYTGKIEFSFRVIESFQDTFVWKPTILDNSFKEETYHLTILKLVRIK